LRKDENKKGIFKKIFQKEKVLVFEEGPECALIGSDGGSRKESESDI